MLKYNIDRRTGNVFFISRFTVLILAIRSIFEPCLVIAVGTKDVFREALFKRNVDIEEVSAEHMLWLKPKKSYVSCSAQCSQDDECTFIIFSRDFGKCYGFADTLIGRYSYKDLEAAMKRDAVDSLIRYNIIKSERQEVSDKELSNVPCSGWHKIGEGLYFFSNDSLDWDSARRWCSNALHVSMPYMFKCLLRTNIFIDREQSCLTMDGHLLAMETNGEYTIIEDFISSQCNHVDIWVGGNNKGQEIHWEWVDIQRTINITHWYPGEPNSNQQDCMEIAWGWSHTTLWGDGPCNNEKKYICERF